MEYIEIDGTPVSRIGLGTWAIGGLEWGATNREDSIRTCLAILDEGMNLIDTAPIYGRGAAEEIVGEAMRQNGARQNFYIATKAGLDWSTGAVLTNSTPERLRAELEGSLRRLRTDYIDLYQVHWPDPLVPVAEVAGTMLQFQREGKVRALGVSNFSEAQMERWRAVAPLHSDQPPYNLFERAAEAGVLPYCREHGVSVLTYSSLCRSLLAGRLTPEMTFDATDIRSADPKFQPPRFAQYLAAVDRLDAFAEQHYGKRVLHLAVRWVLDQLGVGAALWGAKRPAQLAPVREIMGWKLERQAFPAIDAILQQTVRDPVGPEYLTPGVREAGVRETGLRETGVRDTGAAAEQARGGASQA